MTLYTCPLFTKLNKKSEIVATCPLVLFAGESYMGTALCTPPYKRIHFFHKIHIEYKFMGRDFCETIIQLQSLPCFLESDFFSNKRYTTWANNEQRLLPKILEEEEEHLPVVRRDLVLDESVDERADPLFTQALSRSRLAISPPLNYLVLSNLDIKRQTSFLQWREPAACLRPDLCVTSVTKVWVAIMWGRTNITKRWVKAYLCNLQVCLIFTCR